MDYPEEWNELPKRERKKKIRKLKKSKEKRRGQVTKIRNIAISVVIIALVVVGYRIVTRKSPEEIVLEREVKEVSLEGKVEEFPIEGQQHVSPGTVVSYDTNPPTSGGHLAQAENWGVNDKEIEDKAAVHGLEHGGIWITYKDISEETKKVLEDVGRSNPNSVIVSPRPANDDIIAVVSWGRMMRLEVVDKALIQKYIDTYINQSPEKLAR